MNIPISVLVLRSITMLLTNYVKLEPGIPTRMHFTDHYYIEREIMDPERGTTKTVKSLVFWVDELGGLPSARTFSVLSQKLAAHLEPYLKGKQYIPYDFVITESGSGFFKDWNVQSILKVPAPPEKP